ncbi:MAG TPA: PEP-CTERM sorting domain-containing protein [Pirellulales bacterium]|jgi:hypothetical protein
MKSIVRNFLFVSLLLECLGSPAQAVDIWEKIDNSNASLYDTSSGSPIEISSIAIDSPLHGANGLPSIPVHVMVADTTVDNSSLTFGVFYDGLAGDLPSSGSIDLRFQFIPPNGLPSAGIMLSKLESSGTFPGADFGASGLLIAQWAGTHHFAMSTKGAGARMFTSVSPSYDGTSSFFDILADLALPSGNSDELTQPLFSVTLSSQSVPEPSTIALAILGLLGVAGWQGRPRQSSPAKL